MDMGQLGRGEGLRESSPEVPWSCRGWDSLPRGEHGKTAPAPLPLGPGPAGGLAGPPLRLQNRNQRLPIGLQF